MFYQWGNELKLIADELKEYPNIELRWKEVGLSFQVQFVNMSHNLNTDTYVGNVGNDVGDETNDNEGLLIELVRQNSKITAKEIANTLKLSKRQCERIIADLKKRGSYLARARTGQGDWIIV